MDKGSSGIIHLLEKMNDPVILLLSALLLDLCIGDPRYFPHPVNGIGRIALFCEKWWRKIFFIQSSQSLIWAGLASVMSIVLISGGLSFLSFALIARLGPIWEESFAVLIISFMISFRSLAEHSYHVANALEEEQLLKKAREKLSLMVGRDVDRLDRKGIIRATVESTAESLSDGIIAPLFYAFLGWFLGGATGAGVAAVIFRAVNTMDSLFGYHNERYQFFGFWPARLDDILCLLPARLAALCAILSSFLLNERGRASLSIWWRDRRKHPSPNAGQCESVFAGSLGLQLGGGSFYQGIFSPKPYLGEKIEEEKVSHIIRTLYLMAASVLIFMLILEGIVCGIAVLRCNLDI